MVKWLKELKISFIIFWNSLEAFSRQKAPREYTRNSQISNAKKEKKYVLKKNNHTKQYLCGLAICLHPRNCDNFTIHKDKYRMRQYSFSLPKQNTKP